MNSFKFKLFAMMFSQLLKVFLGLASTIILAKFLGAEDRGLFAIAITIPTILSLFLSFGLPQINFIYSGLYKDKLDELMGISIVVCIVMSAISTFGLISLNHLGQNFIGKLSNGGTLLIYLVCCLITLFTFNFVFKELLKGRGEIVLLSKIISFEAIGILIGYVICYLLGLTLIEALWVQILAAGISFCIILTRLLLKIRPKFKVTGQFLLKIIKKGYVYYLGSIAIAIALHSPVIIMNYYTVDLKSIASFAIAYSLMQQCELLPSVLVNVILPKLSNEKHDPKNLEIKVLLAFRLNISILLIALIAACLAVTYIISPILGEEYAYINKLSYILAIGVLFSSGSKIINIYFNLMDHPKYDVLPTWVRCFFQILLTIILIDSFGVEGVAWAIVISRLIRIALSVMLMSSAIKGNLGLFMPKISDIYVIKSFIYKKKIIR